MGTAGPMLRRRRKDTKDVVPDYTPYIEHARFLVNWYWNIGDAYERKVVQLLAFNGVILALLPNLAGPLKTMAGAPNLISRIFAMAAIVALLLSCGCCLLSLRRRDIYGPGAKRLREDWPNRRTMNGADAVESIGIALLDGPDETAVLPTLRSDVKSRGRWMSWASLFLGAALVLLGVPVSIIVQQAVG